MKPLKGKARWKRRDVEKLAIKDRSPKSAALLATRQKLRHFHAATMSYDRETLFTQPQAFPYKERAVCATTELHTPCKTSGDERALK